MTSKSTKSALCKHKQSAPCPSCRLGENVTEQAGAWVTITPRATDYPSFVRDNPDALRTTNKTTTQPQTQPKKPTQQPASSNNKSNNSQRPYRHHPSLAPSNLKHPQQATTPASSVAATRASSPVTRRTTKPVYNPRKALAASADAAVVARGYSRALTPQTVNQLSAQVARTRIVPVPELAESEEESEEESEDSSDHE